MCEFSLRTESIIYRTALPAATTGPLATPMSLSRWWYWQTQVKHASALISCCHMFFQFSLFFLYLYFLENKCVEAILNNRGRSRTRLNPKEEVPDVINQVMKDLKWFYFSKSIRYALLWTEGNQLDVWRIVRQKVNQSWLESTARRSLGVMVSPSFVWILRTGSSC